VRARRTQTRSSESELRAVSCIYRSTVAVRRRMMSNWQTMTHCYSPRACQTASFAPIVLAALSFLGLARAAAPGLVGTPAPDFGLPPAVAGDNVRLSEYRGQPVIVSFWSSRCGTCIKQLAALDRLYQTYRSSGLVVLAVGVDDNLVNAREYARARKTTYPLLLDIDKSASRGFRVDRLPTAVLIDRSGVVRYVHSDDGADDRSYVVEIRTLLDGKPAVP
jgi:cytochrome c biogenesis protein CcmG, thiol:disulfide interchange protein DsbE